MITQSITICRGFVLCTGAMTKNEVLNHSNTGDGVFTQLLYILSGTVTANHNNQSIFLDTNQVTDISALANLPIEYLASNEGVTWIGVNPVPATKRFNYELVNTSKNITGSSKETFVLCVEGVITCNDKQLSSLQYVCIPDGKTVALSTLSNSVAVILTEQ